MNHFGGRIPAENMIREAKNGNLISAKELEKKFSEMLEELYKAKDAALLALKEIQTCKHEEYHNPTYTYERRIVNYVYVYKRICKGCGIIEHSQCNYKNEKPEWAEGAEERYHNND